MLLLIVCMLLLHVYIICMLLLHVYIICMLLLHVYIIFSLLFIVQGVDFNVSSPNREPSQGPIVRQQYCTYVYIL